MSTFAAFERLALNNIIFQVSVGVGPSVDFPIWTLPRAASPLRYSCCGAAPNASPSLASLLKPLPPSLSPVIICLLNNNEPPLEADVPVVRHIISDAEERLHALDARILPLQTALAQLVKRRTEVAEHIREHRAIVSPVRRIPPELICEIFDLATAESRSGPRAKPPWRLGRICRPWRQSALAHPSLWNYIVVPAYAMDARELHPKVSELENQLLRCGTISLDIHWSSVHTAGPNSGILDLILPRSNSWRTVSFDIDREYSDLDWLEPIRGKLDSLEKLEVLHELCTFPDVFTAAPNLYQLVLPPIGAYGDDSPTIYQRSFPLPWEQITHYRAKCHFAQQLDILRVATSVSHCALEVQQVQDFVPPATPVVILPQLRRLCLDQVGLLLPIVAPNLEELSAVYSAELIPRILPFVRHASCTLQRLILWVCTLDSELITTLRSLPSLTHLLVQDGDYDQPHNVVFFTALTISGTDADICPNLTSMVYAYVRWDSSASQDSFFRMAESRLRPNPNRPSTTVLSSLRVLSVEPNSGPFTPSEAEIRARVRSLEEEGLNVAMIGVDEATYMRCPWRGDALIHGLTKKNVQQSTESRVTPPGQRRSRSASDSQQD
ncbi:hypothetical protein C8R45DRAFT_1080719 [Mycena sanguinolenta]|nr:hypothetical protein C8R45DRAFT_1080719 [Mycena sanguinolenta]